MWALIIFILYNSDGYVGGAGATTVQGFTTKTNCERVGYETTVEMNNTEYRYMSKGSMFGNGDYKIKADTLRDFVTRYAFRCVKVE